MDIKDLKVYQLALQLIVPVEKLAKLVEANDKILATNLRKTSRQISPSIAEGFSKRASQAEFKRFLAISMGSSDEMIAHLEQVKILEFSNVKAKTCDALIERYIYLSKQLNRLISIIKEKSDL
ncbi:MAG: Uncharacterized protein CEN89_609 [Candidatus Berkelbacteria bacterium Licking1014_7]|uniref:Four helix bundle protein n=1 Tax=Candidatus Berkelbacteria bacterium Licking1014_7 TaxID=2017147 RepID=A0A554LI83_9BACT|nr:MAG: Uncharacterized protein CEN89_609 [Candidatus Berkelbacteria bacterium Licking1014_7]